MAVTTPASTINNPNLIDPGIKKIWHDEFKQLSPKLEMLYKVENLDGAYEDHTGYTGLTELPVVPEGQSFTEDAPIPTYTTRFTAAKRGIDVPVTYELWADQRAKVAGQVKSKARAVARTIEKIAASAFVNGFNTSYTSYGDAKPLFSTTHTRADGGSAQSNASGTGITLTEANLETAILAMRNQLDDRGNLLDIVPDVLIVPPALEKEAIIITGSDQRSGTADNDANVYNMSEYTGGKMKVIVWNYLGAAAGGSDTAWFLQDSKQHQLTWKWRERPTIKRLPEAVGAKNEVWNWRARFRSDIGWTNWRALWGSKGDGAAYSS